MRHLLIFTFTILFALPTFSQDDNTSETTTYYFIRHAEKNRSDANDKNPHLIQIGILRAAKWSLVFEHIKFDAVYSTDYNRTKETAQPTAEKNGLDVTIYDPRQLNSETFIANTKGKTVLVVGHSNTTPMFVNAVLGEKKHDNIDDSNNGNVYIVTISGSGEKTDTLLVVE